MSPTRDFSGKPADEAEEAEAYAQAYADAITKAGMAGPASLGLQIARPLAWVGGQMLWVLEPFIETLSGRSSRNRLSVRNLAKFLEGEGNIDRLAERLDAQQGRDR